MPLKVLSGSSLSMHLYTYVPILMAIRACNGYIAHHSLIGTMALQVAVPGRQPLSLLSCRWAALLQKITTTMSPACERLLCAGAT